MLAAKKDQIGLSFLESLQLKIHMLVCSVCRAASRHIKIIEQAAQHAAERIFDSPVSSEHKLSDQAKETMKTALRAAGKSL
ncbi:MAG TPA: hypothetical protein VMG59_11610 [Phycisphaerae bacterium]|nr:hypothetical protein [Phycisphaerae bacterium]